MVVAMRDGKVLMKDGKVCTTCCAPPVDPPDVEYEVSIRYDWRETGQFDLDTKTTAFGEQVGWNCGDTGTYVAWLPGGSGAQDDTTQNGFERVDVRVDTAKANGLWTSSCNIELFAGWYIPASGTGYANVEVIYNGVTKNKVIAPGSQSGCCATSVGTVTVYANGTFDLV